MVSGEFMKAVDLMLMRLLLPIASVVISIAGLSYVADFHAWSGLAGDKLAPMMQAMEAAVWLAAAWLFNRLVVLVFWEGFVTHVLGRAPPRLIIQLGSIIVFLLAVSGILRFVFGEPITAIWAASGAAGVVIGFALQRLILDTFSGFAIHLEQPFKVGDWINVHHGTPKGFVGRVSETNWRTTRLYTTENNVVIIPNSLLTTAIVTNYSIPETIASFDMDFVLDFSISTERAERVLLAALISSIGPNGPLTSPKPKVRVNGVTDNGVQYRLSYHLDPSEVSPGRARDTVARAVLKHIGQAGLSLSYPRRDLFLARMPWRHKNWRYLKDQIRQLGSISLFAEFEEDDLEFIAKHMSVHEMEQQSVIVRQGEAGDSMFILAEGLLEVFIEQPDGTQARVADLQPGMFFGEKSLLTGQSRSATVICVAESMVCEITKNCIMTLLERKPELAESLGRAVVARDIQNEQALMYATKEEIEAKVASSIGDVVARIRQFFGR